MSNLPHLRSAQASDVGAIVDVFQSARAAALGFVPVLHTDAEDRDFFGGLITGGAATVAVEDRTVIGFIVLGAACVEHLYVAPVAWRRGIGSLLLRHAQALRPAGLDLWVFQRNRAAVAFYEAHGFQMAETTDGAGNEEREPDARMVWSPGIP
ncbi:MAG TPA: GNAT family N-acetyltransferase [Solirubrobacteraceae bacterium]|nr:GNAT family N-acetyltransferase [Solirubrobacteraceae bacterium]